MFDLTLQDNRLCELDILFVDGVHTVSQIFASNRLTAEKDVKTPARIRLCRES